MRLKILSLLLVFFASTLAGCSGSQAPRLIRYYPANEPAIRPQLPGMIIYRTNLKLQVVNPDAAARRALDITTNDGGYQIDADFGYSGDQKTVTFVLAVPSSAYASLRSELLRLGIFIWESQGSRLIGAYSWEDSSYSQIRVHFRPVTYAHPRMNNTAWRSFAT
jgi:hypothetical protein